ncbi:hypothetical protein V3C99_012048, partial [Haemonchus contortus]
GWLAICSSDAKHITHIRCAIRHFGVLRLTCSHCGHSCVPTYRPEIVNHPRKQVISAVNIDFKAPPSVLADQFAKFYKRRASSQRLFSIVASSLVCDRNLQQCFSDLLLALRGTTEKELFYGLVRFLPHCYMPQSKIWSNGELLSTALKSGYAQNVRALREAGCPVHPHHLHLLMKCYSSSVFDGLIMEPEYAICHVTENLITDLITVRSWSYLVRLLEHFGYKTGALDANLPGKVRTLLEACTDVPGDVQAALHRMFQMNRVGISTMRRKIINEDLSEGSERFPVRVVNNVDSATIAEFTYTSRIVDRSGVLAARRSSIETYCCCNDLCSLECECSSGIYDEHGLVDDISLEWPFMECNAACACTLQCGNRVAQKGATVPIEVFRTCDGRGWAVRALRNIRRGTFIGEYTGELLSDDEAARPERSDTYFFETRVGEELHIVDGRLYGNFTRFINHSCRPNARVSVVVWEAQPDQLSHICIFASENILKGAEITISYGKSWWDAKRRQLSCRCGHADCEYSKE